MFRFENAEYLYLLAVIPLLASLHYWTNYRKRKRLRDFGDPVLLRGLMKDVSQWRPEVKTWCMLLALACLILAAARPQFGTKAETVERYGIEAIIAIDVSNSMLANDVRPSRLDRAKMLFSNMIDGMRDDMVGVVAFAGDAFVQLPITNDYVSAKMFLDQINPSLIRVQGTDIGTAIDLSMKCFTQKKDVSRAIFLITDGEDHEGGALEAAKAAAKKGMRVYVLGIGSPEGAHVPIPGTGQYIIDETGEPVVSRMNEEMCRQIAQAGNGAYIYVNNSSSAQEELAKQVDKLGKEKMESTTFSDYDEQFQGFLLIALLLLIADILLLERENHILKSVRLFRRAAAVLAVLAVSSGMQAQSYRDYIRRGNRQFRDSVYDKAQVEYKKGFQKDSDNVQVLYNLADSHLMLGTPEDLQEAMRLLDKAGKAERNPARRAKIFHNMGVILQGQQQFRQAIECYKESLRNNPSDNETRYNMVLCQRQLKDEDNQDNQDNQNQQQDQQQQQQQQQENQNQDQDQDQQQQQPPPEQNEINKDNAEQMLKAAMQKEQQTQDKLQQQRQQPPSRKLQKQW